MHNNVENIPKQTKDYLVKFGIIDRPVYHNASNKLFKAIITIPLFNEYSNIHQLLESLKKCNKQLLLETLILFCINNRVSDDIGIKENNLLTSLYLKNYIDRNESDASVMNIGVIDAYSEGYELSDKDGGVGLARKICMDTALLFFDYSKKEYNIIVCLDGDCEVSSNYLDVIFLECVFGKKSNAVVEYHHPLIENSENLEAIICYEIFLRYYVAMLKYSNSPFAFHTIGSTMICDDNSYIRAGGMNKRKAAEDFYFIERLSKTSKIHCLKGAFVFPSARESLRVPFGTGQRVTRFKANIRDEYQLYAPESFNVLKQWNNEFFSEAIRSSEYYSNRAKEIHLELFRFLDSRKFFTDWDNIVRNTRNAGNINKQKIFKFDAFATLKLIHHLREKVLPEIQMFSALDTLFEYNNIVSVNRSESIPDLSIQTKYLESLRCL